MIESIINYQYMQNAIIATFLASIICGIIGVIIVEKKLVMMSGGIAHTAYGGVGLGYLLGFEPLLGALGFSVAAAFGIGFINRSKKTASDIIIALFWSLGMASGIMFVGMMPSYPPDMNSYLFGNVLSVTKFDILLTVITAGIVLLMAISFFNDIKAYMFDEEFATVTGIKTKIIEYGLLILVAISVVVLIRVAGIILILALLTAPAAAAALFSKNLKNRMVFSSILCFVYCLIGLTFSYYFDLPAGAMIVIVAVTVYFIAYIFQLIRKKIQKKSN